MFGLEDNIFWLLAILVFVVVEGITVQLVSVWFALGALGAWIATLLGAPFWGQAVVFFTISVLVLVVGRPFIQRILQVEKQPTNADRVIGMTGVVLEDVDNLLETGQVSANGLTWTARAKDNQKIAKDSQITVLAIDGVKLIVEPVAANRKEKE